MTSRLRLRNLGAGALLILAAGGCGSSPTPSSGTSSKTTVITSTSGLQTTAALDTRKFSSANQERDKLLALAKAGTQVTSQGTIPGWPAANGAAIPATPSEVSGFGFLVDKAKNVQYLGFAVKDATGKCAGGDIEANPSGTLVVSAGPVTVPSHGPCTGDEAAKLAGHP